MAKNGEVALRLQPGGGLCVPCYPVVDKSGRRCDRDPQLYFLFESKAGNCLREEQWIGQSIAPEA